LWLSIADDDGIVVVMGSVDWNSLPPSPFTDEERRRIMQAYVDEGRAKYGYRSPEENRRALQKWRDERRARGIPDLTPEESERRRFEAIREARIRLTAIRASFIPTRATVQYKYSPPSGPLVVREGPPRQRPDRSERDLSAVERDLMAVRVQMEALESNVNSFADHNLAIDSKLDQLTLRVGGLEQTLERLDLRVLRLEHNVEQLDGRLDRLQQKVEEIDARVRHFEQQDNS